MRATGGILAALCLGFAPTADAEPATDPASEAVLASLPFEKGAPPRTIVIDLAPKGNARRLRFQLDTGATNSYVTPRLARAALPQPAEVVAELQRIDLAGIASIEIGN